MVKKSIFSAAKTAASYTARMVLIAGNGVARTATIKPDPASGIVHRPRPGSLWFPFPRFTKGNQDRMDAV